MVMPIVTSVGSNAGVSCCLAATVFVAVAAAVYIMLRHASPAAGTAYGGLMASHGQHDEPCSLPSARKAGTPCFTVQHPGLLHDRSAVVYGRPQPGACAVNWQSCWDLHALSAFDPLHA